MKVVFISAFFLTNYRLPIKYFNLKIAFSSFNNDTFRFVGYISNAGERFSNAGERFSNAGERFSNAGERFSNAGERLIQR
jgi:hypothetical protein